MSGSGALPRFQDLNFGLPAAADERQQNRQLLIDGYFDLENSFREAVYGYRFLILGYKGSGKSALAQHISIMSENDPDLNVRILTLNDLSFSEFADVVPAGREDQARYPKVWELALLLQVLDMYRGTANRMGDVAVDFQNAVQALELSGLLPARDLATAIRQYVTHPLTAPGFEIPVHGGAKDRLGVLTNLVLALQDLAYRVESPTRQLLIIDGTDELIPEERADERRLHNILKNLIDAASNTNRNLNNAKVLVLCRTDLYERLPGPNKATVRLGQGVELEWFIGHTSAQSPLIQLVNRKVRALHPEVADIFSDYLPRKRMYRGKMRPLHTALQHYTRHTPRDFLQIFEGIREIVARGRLNQHAIPMEAVERGISRYSRHYFGSAIRDEIWGPLDLEERDVVEQILTRIGKERFRAEEFVREAAERMRSLDAQKTLGLLFDCSAIGNVRTFVEGGRRPRDRIIYRYRNREEVFEPRDDVLVHLGWCNRLNIISRLEAERPPIGPTLFDPESVGEVGSTARKRARGRAPSGTAAAEPPVSSPPSSSVPDVPPAPRTRRRASRPQGPPSPPAPESDSASDAATWFGRHRPIN